MQSENNTEARGAEATITFSEYLGRPAVIKSRLAKSYRLPELDSHIRSSRTRNEARVMHDARSAGVRTPCIYDIDVRNCSIVMERMHGISVKDALDRYPEDSCRICSIIGEVVARMHSAHICHGDLTTSNMVLCDDGNICLIDFSMGCTNAELEDIGVDIRLLERAFTSAHTDLDEALSCMMESYYSHVADASKIEHKVEDIRNRGRYT